MKTLGEKIKTKRAQAEDNLSRPSSAAICFHFVLKMQLLVSISLCSNPPFSKQTIGLRARQRVFEMDLLSVVGWQPKSNYILLSLSLLTKPINSQPGVYILISLTRNICLGKPQKDFFNCSAIKALTLHSSLMAVGTSPSEKSSFKKSFLFLNGTAFTPPPPLMASP